MLSLTKFEEEISKGYLICSYRFTKGTNKDNICSNPLDYRCYHTKSSLDLELKKDYNKRRCHECLDRLQNNTPFNNKLKIRPILNHDSKRMLFQTNNNWNQLDPLLYTTDNVEDVIKIIKQNNLPIRVIENIISTVSDKDDLYTICEIYEIYHVDNPLFTLIYDNVDKSLALATLNKDHNLIVERNLILTRNSNIWCNTNRDIDIKTIDGIQVTISDYENLNKLKIKPSIMSSTSKDLYNIIKYNSGLLSRSDHRDYNLHNYSCPVVPANYMCKCGKKDNIIKYICQEKDCFSCYFKQFYKCETCYETDKCIDCNKKHIHLIKSYENTLPCYRCYECDNKRRPLLRDLFTLPSSQSSSPSLSHSQIIKPTSNNISSTITTSQSNLPIFQSNISMSQSNIPISQSNIPMPQSKIPVGSQSSSSQSSSSQSKIAAGFSSNLPPITSMSQNKIAVGGQSQHSSSQSSSSQHSSSQPFSSQHSLTEPLTDDFNSDKDEISEITESISKLEDNITQNQNKILQLKQELEKEESQLKTNNHSLEALKKLKTDKEAANSLKTTKIKRKNLPKAVRSQVWKAETFANSMKGKCWVCNREIEYDTFHCGHIIAVSKGGSDRIDNLKPVCSRCNIDCGDMDMSIFKNNYFKK